MNDHAQFDVPAPEALLAGDFSGMAIDDTGTPGHLAPSVHLHPQRKTWVAVLIPPEEMAEVSKNLPGTIAHVCSCLGVDELHFADILSGKGPMRGLPYEARVDAFRVFARVFAVLRLPIIMQTYSPDNVLEQQESLSRYGKVAGIFDLHDPSDLALLGLLWRTRSFIAENSAAFHKPLLAFLDEGRFRAGRAIQLGSLLDFAHQGALFVASSRDVALLQLADFAAFALNRVQRLLAKSDRSERDQELLEILAGADFQGIAMRRTSLDAVRDWSTADFDALHETIRKDRGLHPIPGRGRRRRDDS